MPRVRSAFPAVLLLVVGAALHGCTPAQPLAVEPVPGGPPPEGGVLRDLAYADDGDPRHRLNLFLPEAEAGGPRPWPLVVFAHGGGWTEGDPNLTVDGEEVYSAIGRYFARHGIGAAVIGYRLMPEVTWREQVDDVARAVAWLHRNVGAYGGDPEGLFVMGHSAGAYLAAFVALDPEPLGAHGVPAGVVCGAIPASGAALDLTDEETYRLEGNFRFYSYRFSPDRVERREPPPEPAPWQGEASPVRHVRADAPPFLLLHGGREREGLQRQSRLLDAALREAGAESAVVVLPGLGHRRVVGALSRDDQTAGPAMLAFIRAQRCG